MKKASLVDDDGIHDDDEKNDDHITVKRDDPIADALKVVEGRRAESMEGQTF